MDVRPGLPVVGRGVQPVSCRAGAESVEVPGCSRAEAERDLLSCSESGRYLSKSRTVVGRLENPNVRGDVDRSRNGRVRRNVDH